MLRSWLRLLVGGRATKIAVPRRGTTYTPRAGTILRAGVAVPVLSLNVLLGILRTHCRQPEAIWLRRRDQFWYRPSAYKPSQAGRKTGLSLGAGIRSNHI